MFLLVEKTRKKPDFIVLFTNISPCLSIVFIYANLSPDCGKICGKVFSRRLMFFRYLYFSKEKISDELTGANLSLILWIEAEEI